MVFFGPPALYLCVDELQNFVTTSFIEMLSESRKHQVLPTVAEQSTQQQFGHKLIEVILANVGTVVVFRLGSLEDLHTLWPMFSPFVDPVNFTNLPIYNLYSRMEIACRLGFAPGITRLL